MIALDPAGRLLDDALVDELAAEPALTLLSGRYEGFDERILEHFASTGCRSAATSWPAASWRRWSCATRCCASSRARSVIERSAVEESFSAALEGGPSTRTTRGRPSTAAGGCPRSCSPGHHARIGQWRLEQSRARAAWRDGRRAAGRRRRARGRRRADAGETAGAVRPRPRPPGPATMSGRMGGGARRARPDRGRPPPAAIRLSAKLQPMSTVIDSLERTQLRRGPGL